MIELGVAHSRGPKEEQVNRISQALLAVPGVTSVEDHLKSSQTFQGSVGNQFQDTIV